MLPDVLPTLLLAAVLVVGALGLLLWQARTWRAAIQSPLEEAEYQFRRQRFRRHIQTTALAAVVAAALPVGVLLMHSWPRVSVLFWGGVLLLVAWICVLALADVLATGRHYGKVRTQFLDEQLRLQAELYRARGRRRNGHNPKPPDTPEEPPPEAGDR